MNESQQTDLEKAQAHGYFLERLILYMYFRDPTGDPQKDQREFTCLSLPMLKKFIKKWKHHQADFTKWDGYVDAMEKEPNPPVDMRYLTFGSELADEFKQSLIYLAHLGHTTCICGMPGCLTPKIVG